MKYDTLLFGNGLTKALFFNFNKGKSLLDFDTFLKLFLEKSKNEKSYFYKILDSNIKSSNYLLKKDIEDIEKYLQKNLDEILKNGFEVCSAKDGFKFDTFLGDVNTYYLALYNYWWETIKPRLYYPFYSKEIKKCIECFKQIGIVEFYTTNFDKYLDRYIKVEHIHGSFIERFKDLQQMTSFIYDKSKIVNKCLSGATGLEKLNHLYKAKQNNVVGFDTDFLFTKNKQFGNLLIYGMRFADTLLVPEDIMKKYSEKDVDLVRYVDGHIMLRLDSLYLNNQITSITICYYTEADKERYNRVFSKRICSKIIKYCKSSDIY